MIPSKSISEDIFLLKPNPPPVNHVKKIRQLSKKAETFKTSTIIPLNTITKEIAGISGSTPV
jgi:hypothetical protein